MSVIRSRSSFVILMGGSLWGVFSYFGEAKEPLRENSQPEPRVVHADQSNFVSEDPFLLRGLFPRSPATTDKLWQLESRTPRSWVSSVSWHPDGQLLAVGEGDGCVRVYNPLNWELVDIKYCEGRVEDVTYSPDGKWIAARIVKSAKRPATVKPNEDYERTIPILKIWKADGTGTAETSVGVGKVANLVWSPDSQRIAVVSNYRAVRVMNLKGETQFLLGAHRNTIYALGWSPQGNKIASRSRDGELQVWDLTRAGQQRDRVKRSPSEKWSVPSIAFRGDKGINDFQWMPDGQSLVCSESSGRIFLQHLNGQTEELSEQLGGSHLALHRDGKRLAVSDR
ncbi:MAG: hypothetical protein KDA84_27885, partial [Planctomycetaceae bacterium]|nr:hypothetical protein [Planctomycetaceae bacterium]